MGIDFDFIHILIHIIRLMEQILIYNLTIYYQMITVIKSYNTL